MARVSNEEKAKTHEKIIDIASEMFRNNGIEATGVADIMKAANLTHGGFYRHFTSKTALAIEAIERAISESLSDLEEAKNKSKTDKKAAIQIYIQRYLSEEHVMDSANGCPLAALGTEAPHMPEEIANVFTNGTKRAIAAIANTLNQDQKNQNAALIMTTLIGSVILARMSRDDVLQNSILVAAKKSTLTLLG
ncbi:MAG: TetR/AcrR family transcriptional regulator [OCS116 cluster bacterium]|nr:TetR/AcrR family transcriptional regulator [OCS116 cluster bacterium]